MQAFGRVRVRTKAMLVLMDGPDLLYVVCWADSTEVRTESVPDGEAKEAYPWAGRTRIDTGKDQVQMDLGLSQLSSAPERTTNRKLLLKRTVGDEAAEHGPQQS